MKTINHNEEIVQSRTGGFGGSDAAMFYRIGYRGLECLTNTDKKRIRVAKGIDAYQSIPMNDAMQRGHDFEDWYARQPFAPIAKREGLLESQKAQNFRTFAHADFLSDCHEVWELKCVQEPEAAEDDYYHQLQWYYMLGAYDVWLVVSDSRLADFSDGLRMPYRIYEDAQYIECLQKGVQMLDEAWETIDLTLSEEWDVSELMPFEKVAIIQMYNSLQSIKTLEKRVEDEKAKILQFMQENNVRAIKSDMYAITYVAESETRTLDKSALKKANPDLDLSKYDKVTKKKAYITVKIKE
jgi:hypothetical protein